jgi:hypothetical protein
MVLDTFRRLSPHVQLHWVLTRGAAGQAGIGAEVILPRRAALPGAAQVPAHPVGLALVAVVGERVLVFHQQVVAGRGGGGHGAAGVSQRQVVIAAGAANGGYVLGFGAGAGQEQERGERAGTGKE